MTLYGNIIPRPAMMVSFRLAKFVRIRWSNTPACTWLPPMCMMFMFVVVWFRSVSSLL